MPTNDSVWAPHESSALPNHYSVRAQRGGKLMVIYMNHAGFTKPMAEEVADTLNANEDLCDCGHIIEWHLNECPHCHQGFDHGVDDADDEELEMAMRLAMERDPDPRPLPMPVAKDFHQIVDDDLAREVDEQ